MKSFGADPALNLFRPEVVHWKYFADHPEWTSPRSFAVKQDGKIVAHGGVWPVSFATPKAEVKAIHLIDWTASRSAVGAGVYLLRKMAGLADMLLTIGGSGYEETFFRNWATNIAANCGGMPAWFDPGYSFRPRHRRIGRRP